MDNFGKIKTFAQQRQDLFLFMPVGSAATPAYSSLLKRLSTVNRKFRRLLTPTIHTSCATLATVILVFFHGLFIFLLLLLDITLQDSFLAFDCRNSNRTKFLVPGQDEAWVDIDHNMKRPLQTVTTVLVTLFLVESALRAVILGKQIVYHYWEIADSLTVLLCFSLNLSNLVNFSLGKQAAQFIIFFRLWRVLELYSGGTFSSSQPSTPKQYSHRNSTLRQQTSTSSNNAICDTTAYSHEQSVTTLMLRIEELEQEISYLNRIPACQRCINHNWTTDELLKKACMQLSRSESRYKEELRAAKSMDDLSLGSLESGYSSTKRKACTRTAGYPALIHRLSDRVYGQQRSSHRPLQTVVDIEGILLQLANGGEISQSEAELSEIQRVAQVQFRPETTQRDIPVTSL